MNQVLPPSRRHHYFAAAALALLSISCGDDSNDAATPGTGDSGTTAHVDAGANTGIDASTDSGPPVNHADATTPAGDSGVVGDAATGDAATGDAATGDAATGDAGIPTYNDCTPDKYVDRSAPGADRTITFGNNFKYAPPCITIAAGQSVTWKGDFGAHPLSPGVGGSMTTVGSPNSPIKETKATAADTTFMFPTAGAYPYVCEYHYAAPHFMVGSVQVK
ncbi:MAG: hypothetical protein JWN04_6009 [Myxococcaceae bacterium]|nr:hypothetical protein [Myxococcaceae bacterium]